MFKKARKVKDGKRLDWLYVIKSCKGAFHVLDVFYLFSWILLFFSVYLVNRKSEIITATWIAFLAVCIVRLFPLAEISLKHYKTHKILSVVEGTLILGILILTFIPGILQPYFPAPVRRAVINLFISYCIVLSNDIAHRRIKYGLLNVLVFAWGMISTQIGHMIYVQPGFIRHITDSAFKHILPETSGIILGDISWLSLGISLFGACVVIVNWFKENPCRQWNPYTVQEIGLSDHVVYFSLVCISSLLYCSICDMNRAPVFPIAGLLFFDVYALYLKNAQNNDVLVRRKVIQKMNVRQLVFDIIKEDKEGRKNKTHCFYLQTKKELFSFSDSVRDITRTILASNSSMDIMVENYIQLASYIFLYIPGNDSAYSTIGFIFGLASVPPWHINEKNASEIETFIQSINNTVSKEGHLQHPYYRALINGLNAGVAKTRLPYCNDDKTWYKRISRLADYTNESVTISGVEKGRKCDKTITSSEEFYTWLVYRWLSFKEPYKNTDANGCWKWVDEIWTRLN